MTYWDAGTTAFGAAIMEHAVDEMVGSSPPRPWVVQQIPFGKRPKRLPSVLGAEEVSQLLACVPLLKHRTVLLTLYAAGLRLSEATHLRIRDVDGQRMQIHITNGKGRKERLVPISPRLLHELREYWKHGRPSNFLFPG